MFTSDKENEFRRSLRYCAGNMLFAGFCALFGAIYEVFSFGVFSFSMIYAFAFPFAAGIVFLISYMRGKAHTRLFSDLFTAAAVTAALGSLAAGVVGIYGSENRLLIIYPVAAGALFTASLVVLAAGRVRTAKQIGTAETE